MDNQGNFLDLKAFNQSTSINTNFLQYQGVIECLKKLLKNKETHIDSNMIGPIVPKLVHTILKQRKGSHNIYEVLNQNTEEPTGKIKWNQLYHLNENAWEHIFLAPFKLTKCTKLRWFQTCINHRILVTNKFLFQIKVIDSPKCSFCGDTEETIDHVLWNCLKTKRFLQELTERFQEMRISLNLNEVTFILGNFPQNILNIL